jgi:hypothetical protein
MGAKKAEPLHKQLSFTFRKNWSVGDIDAATDKRYLHTAFLDTGQLEQLLDTDVAKCVVVGRTGAGKTALLLKLEERERVYRINPAALSLRYLSNSTMLPYLAGLGVNLDIFYRLLWRHVLVTELIKRHFNLGAETGQRTFVQAVTSLIPILDRGKKLALEYMSQWSPSFWEESDTRVKEITEKLEQKVGAELGGKLGGLKGNLSAADAEEQTVSMEEVQRAQKVVQDISLELVEMGMKILQDHVLDDPQKPHFIIIDDLDRNWVDSKFAYDLIEALLETVGDFARMDNVKIVVALRENIIEALHGRPHKQRQQREKHEKLFLRLRWSYPDLVTLVNRRLAELLRGQYGGTISLDTLLPTTIPKKGHTSAVDWILERTSKRPRDLIDFINHCLSVAADEGKNRLTWEVLRTAERRYSRARLHSLQDEWYDNYGDLRRVFAAFERIEDGFGLEQFHPDRFLGLLVEGERAKEPESLLGECYLMHERNRPSEETAVWVLHHLYRIGLLGVKVGPASPIVYSYDVPELADQDFGPNARYYIHPAYYDVLQIENRKRP